MIKVVSADSWSFDEPTARLVKVSSQGLRGHDLNEFIKRAGHDFSGALHLVRPGEVPVHLIAMGATEAYGPNRNGDGFKEAALKRRVDTFEKYAHYFRDHINKDDALRYGRVIKAAYNDQMRRVELLVGLFETAAAAKSAGVHGRVADREMQKLASGKDLPVSMSCRVPLDVCSHCGNPAANRSEYCDTTSVKLASRTVAPCSGFGCRDGLTKVGADGRIQHVDNPDPTFFDISGVYRPADRIAYALGVVKAASLAKVSGAFAAEELGLEAPGRLGVEDYAWRPQLVKLAEAQARPEPFDAALLGSVRPEIAPPHGITPEDAMAALAHFKIAMTPREWLVTTLGADAADAVDAVESRVPGVFARMLDEGDAPDVGRWRTKRAASPRALAWAAKYADAALDTESLVRRAERATLRGITVVTEKRAAAAGLGAEHLARSYAAYAVAFLADTGDSSPALARAVARQSVAGPRGILS